MATVSPPFKDPMAAGLSSYDPLFHGLCDLLLLDAPFPFGDVMKDPRLRERHLLKDDEDMEGVEHSSWRFSDTVLPIRAPSSAQLPFAPSQLGTLEHSDSAVLLGAAETVYPTANTADEWYPSIAQHAHILETSEDSVGSGASPIYTPASSRQDGSSPQNSASMDADEEIIFGGSPPSPGHTTSLNNSRHRYLPRSPTSAPLPQLNQQAPRPVNVSGDEGYTYPGSTTVLSPATDQWTTRAHFSSLCIDGGYGDSRYDAHNVFYSGFQPYGHLTIADYSTEQPLQPADEYAVEQLTFRTPLKSQETPLSWPYESSSQPQYLTVSPHNSQMALHEQSPLQDVDMLDHVEPVQGLSASLLRNVINRPQWPTASSDMAVQKHFSPIETPPPRAQQPAQSSRNVARAPASQAVAIPLSMRKKDGSYSPPSSSSRQSAMIVKKANRTLAKAEPSSAESRSPADSSTKIRKGGRRHQLSETARQRTADMRTSGACWKCVMQRDKCDDKVPCSRCVARAQRVSTQTIDCNRDKIPDFKSDFLPSTMTYMHEEQSIESTLRCEVSRWREDCPIHVELHNGYGPPLRWTVYEFIPKSPELLTQLQYFQDPATRTSRVYKKYSPPFGLLKLDSTDKDHVEAYLEQLMTEDYLEHLGWACFEEENIMDAGAFQCRLLNAICRLFIDTQDGKLKDFLGSVIRMMIITYIMGHTLTIADDTLESVLSNIKHSPQPEGKQRHTSPRLANRQLKFFFAALRLDILNPILRWQQRTFQTGGPRHATWLTSFCAMLGLAMVLEEIQRTLQIQADAKIQKEEMSQTEAIAQACAACRGIDGRFDLLDRLFRWKYPSKKFPAPGSFGPGTPELEGEAENEFLTRLRALVEDNVDHLESRKSVECRHESQCQFTSRLVAKFLLPFVTGRS